MEKVRLSVFDVFGAILPGTPLLIAFAFLYSWQVPSIESIATYISDISLSMAFAGLIVCYCLGFAAQYPAYELFKVLIKAVWPKRLKDHEVSIGKRGAELSSVRHNSAVNAETLSAFLALRTMSYNFFFSFLTLGLTCVLLWCCVGHVGKEPFVLLALSLVLSLGFLRRAVSFHEWSQGLITDTMKAIGSKPS
jgi:hypothetical protein